jgi:hypothetical protein
LKPKRAWTAKEDKALRGIYPRVSTSKLARQLDRSESSVYMRAYVLGIRKSAEYLASPDAFRFRRGYHAGWEHRFKKGQTPANKGLRRRGWGPGRMKETQFKKGTMPHNTRPVGSERVCKDGYLERKVAETGYIRNDWRSVHVLTWEEANGPVPKGHAVVFKDGNKKRIALENLELVSRAELMARNTVHRLPKEIALAIQLTGALNRQIRKHEKQNVRPSQPSL